jgi:hypothetical protein
MMNPLRILILLPILALAGAGLGCGGDHPALKPSPRAARQGEFNPKTTDRTLTDDIKIPPPPGSK